MDYLAYLFFRFGIGLVSVMGKSGRSVIQGLIKFILHRIVQYRKQVIYTNLSKSFPDMNAAQIQGLADEYYRHLATTFIDVAFAYSMNESQVRNQFVVPDMHIPDKLYLEGRPAIFLGAHRGNWELAALAVGLYFRQPVWVVYKPLRNKYLDNYLRHSRAKFNIRMVSMHDLVTLLQNELNTNPVIIMLADQYPVGKSKIEIEFLGLSTLWLSGASVISRRYRLLPYYFEIQKRKYADAAVIKPLDPDDLMFDYTHHLAQGIRSKPVDWLWSHRRWKNLPEFYQA